MEERRSSQLEMMAKINAMDKKLDVFMTRYESENGNILRLIDGIYKIIDKHDKYFDGNGAPGIRAEILLLKEDSSRYKKHAFAAWAAVIGVIIDFLYGKLFK